MSQQPTRRLAVLTSGGDAQGMNAAVRAVVRTALHEGAEVFAVYEGYQGMVDGGDGIRQVGWDDVGSVLHLGGTVIGTYRSKDFRERAGRLRAAQNLLERGIDRLVVIGGDGSLSGLDLFRAEWPGLLAELVDDGRVSADAAAAHPQLMIAGLVGSIDNDLVGTDMTIGADSALHRIVEAVDALASTAASHQRSFVVEVMGRHCGYLALAAAIAGGCDYVLVPEHPPAPGWEDRMCAELRRGRSAGRRDSIVLVAEGAQDRDGNPITADHVRAVIEERLAEDTRVTILGHVQRGGRPSAYDRWASSWLGWAAAREVLAAEPDSVAQVVGLRGNRVVKVALEEAVERTREVPRLIAAGDFDAAMALRGRSFVEMSRILADLTEPPATEPPADARRVAVLHAGGLAPGMNAAARAAVRLGIERGHTMLGVTRGFRGLAEGQVAELSWGDVEGWTAPGGAELGTSRHVPETGELYAISRAMEENRIDALVVVGGYNGYLAARTLASEQERYPGLRVPIVCVPASIDDNLPGSELSIGADTALNTVVEAIDRIKASASAARRCFVVETMGRWSGYLAFMSGLAAGAERVYLHEDGITLADLERDAASLRASFDEGRRLWLAVRNERANEHWTTDWLGRLFEEEAGGRCDVRTAVIGHVQQGGDPSPFDRILATRLAGVAIDDVSEQLAASASTARCVGLGADGLGAQSLATAFEGVDPRFRRPRDPWWLALRPVLEACNDPHSGALSH